MLNKIKSLDCGLFLIRLGLAVVFIAHGWQKWQNIAGAVTFFESLGLAAFFAYLVATVELAGGLAMLLGVFTDWAGWLLATDMFFAIYLVKWRGGLLGGYEFELMLLLAAIAIALTEPGKYTVKKYLGLTS